MRWHTHFDGFSFRLIAPGTFLVFIGTLRHFELSFSEKDLRFLSIGILIICFMAVFCQALYKTMRNIQIHRPSYFENIEKIKANFQDVEARSVVIFGDNHLSYLRPDISKANPKSSPYYNEMEHFDTFLRRIDPDRHIYIKIPEELSADRFHGSIIEYVRKHQSSDIVRIR